MESINNIEDFKDKYRFDNWKTFIEIANKKTDEVEKAKFWKEAKKNYLLNKLNLTKIEQTMIFLNPELKENPNNVLLSNDFEGFCNKQIEIININNENSWTLEDYFTTYH